MNITRKNYESYFIDLLDGTLTTRETDELLDFLRENPDLAEELKGLEAIHLKADEALVFDKQSLLKGDFDHPELLEDSCIRYVENELTNDEKQAFESYVSSHPVAARQLQLYQATVSEPDLLLTYPYKKQLKRSRKIVAPVWLAAAASIVLALVFWFNRPAATSVLNVAEIAPLSETPKAVLNTDQLRSEMATLEMDAAFEQASQQQEEVRPRQREAMLMPLMAGITESVKAAASAPYDDHLREFGKTEQPKLNTEPFPTINELLAREISEFDPRNEMDKFAQLALNKIKQVSDEKLDYSVDKGKIDKIEYNSKLFAFSIPVRGKE
ncbi:anti-sigma factor [Roseimarinus sediminis]|uniref:hypothetical protein n=1 Tax=Roseimarinus sediminis TaxID=1610899 RepID=UPI003D1AD8E2